MLKAVAKEVTGILRKGDLLGRLGGEEFGILLQLADTDLALDTAERLRRCLEELTVPHDPPLQVTASFGVATLTAAMETAQQWLAAADGALYEAKYAGRNRCCVAGETNSSAG